MADLFCSGFPGPFICLRSQRDTVGALLPRTQYQMMLPWLLHCLSLLLRQSNSSNLGSYMGVIHECFQCKAHVMYVHRAFCLVECLILMHTLASAFEIRVR